MSTDFDGLFPDDATLLAKFTEFGTAMRDIMSDMNTEQICATPIAGKWSTQQVMIHLADADVVFTHRLKRIIAEDNPTYNAWSETRFVERLAYDKQCFDDAALIVEVNHRQMSRVLKALDPSVLDRTGTHAQRGPQTARGVLQYATWHIWHHLNFVKEKKKALGISS